MNHCETQTKKCLRKCFTGHKAFMMYEVLLLVCYVIRTEKVPLQGIFFIDTYENMYVCVFNFKSFVVNPNFLVNLSVMLNEIPSVLAINKQKCLKRLFLPNHSYFCLAPCKCLYFINDFPCFLNMSFGNRLSRMWLL